MFDGTFRMRTPTRRSGAKKKISKSRRAPRQRPPDLRAQVPWALRAALFTLEWLAAALAACGYALAVFGRTFVAASWVAPFWLRVTTASAVSFAVATGLLAGWSLVRTRLVSLHTMLPAGLVLLWLASAWWIVQRTWAPDVYADLQSVLASRAESERQRLAHQVYAAYRRANLQEYAAIFRRAEPFLPVIEEAAERFGLPHEVLVGLAATESSFLPRRSRDGGQGLFQITLVPEAARRAAEVILGQPRLDFDNPRHNVFVAAATLHYYWQQQKGDLFLALLAYNMGPQNGGLQYVMERYGAKDFLTIQPYLQSLPADYPIRVLAAALAYRVYRQEGRLLAYEQGENARRVQSLGIPGLD